MVEAPWWQYAASAVVTTVAVIVVAVGGTLVLAELAHRVSRWLRGRVSPWWRP